MKYRITHFTPHLKKNETKRNKKRVQSLPSTQSSNLVAKSLVHPRISAGVQQLRVNPEPEPAGEPDRPQHAKGVVQKRLAGGQRCPHQTLAKICRSFPRVVLDRVCVDVVEQRVDRQVPFFPEIPEEEGKGMQVI